MKITKKIILGIVVFSLLLSIGCSNNENNLGEKDINDQNGIEKELEIIGGDIVKYDICLDEYTKLGFPIISNKKINSLEIESFDFENIDGANVLKSDEYTVDLDNYMEYKDYYIYTLILVYDYDKENKDPIAFSMNNIKLKINNELIDYKLNDVNITNRAYYVKKNNCEFEEGSIKYSGNFIGVRGQCPNLSNEELATSGFKPECSGVEILEFELLNYVTISGFKVDGKTTNPKSINRELIKDEYIGFEYEVNYKNGVDDTNIVRTSQILKYKENGKNRVFILTSGMYIYPSFNEKGCVKKYIDKL